MPQYFCSPLGLVPKHDGGWRRIHDLSFPYRESVNNGIPRNWGALKYVTYDKAVEALQQQGQGAQLVKRDLKDAFRHILVASSDQWLLGFYCNGRYWMKRYLPFGLRTSPFIFNLFAKALHCVLAAVLMRTIILHYLDDFFAILSTKDDPIAYADQFDQLRTDLGQVSHRSHVIIHTSCRNFVHNVLFKPCGWTGAL